MHPSEIKIGQNEYRAYQLVEFIESKKLKLTEKKGWDNVNMSMSIESILLGLTMTPFYFDASNPDSWFVLDGRKRLQSLYNFFKGKFALTELDFFPDYENKYFNDLPFSLQAKLEESIFTVYSINQGVSERVRLNLVLRIVPDLRSALSWEFKESLIDGFKKEELDLWMQLPEYDFAKSHFKAQAKYQLILEYIKLMYIQNDNSNIKLQTNIEHVIFELNENPKLDNIGWELGLDRLATIFNRHNLKYNNLYLNKSTIPILIFYFGNKINELKIASIKENIELFLEKWKAFYLKEGKILLKRNDANIIYRKIDKIVKYD